MKKTFLFLIAPLLLISCKKETATEVTTEEASKSMTMIEPTDTIVIDKDSVDAAWLEANKTYICGRDTNSDIFVALSSITENTQNTARAKWLRDNNRVINYDSSSKYVLASHTIPTSTTLPALGLSSPNLTYKAIQDSINSDKTDSFKNDRYDDYVKFSFSGNEVHVTVIDTFDPGARCYSIPFLRSIAKQNSNINDNTRFMFGEAVVDGKSIIFFQPEGSNRLNYSNKPPRD
jgi:hypothetical protein